MSMDWMDLINISWAPALVSAFMLLGLLLHMAKSDRQRDPKETLLNIFIYLGGAALQQGVINGFQDSFFADLQAYTLIAIPETALTWVLAYLAVDFSYYWRHRAEHHFSFLWAEHCVHHSSHEFNLSTAGRLGWIMIAFGWIGYLPLVLLGFSPDQIITCWSVNMAFQFLSHIETVGSIPVLDSVLSTPSNHRVHHAENEIYWGKNLGGTFIIWDRLFGTYQPQTEPARIGGRNESHSQNPLTVNFKPMYQYLYGRLVSR